MKLLNLLIYKIKVIKNSYIFLFEREMKILRKILIGSDICIDIGANNGYFSEFMSRFSKEVISFEPQNIQRYPVGKNIKYLNLAVSNKSEALKLNIPKLKHKSSLATFYTDFLENENIDEIITYNVNCIKLDSLISTSNEISFVKIDVEGHELKALEGARKLIELHSPLLFIEISSRKDLENQKIFNFLEELSYQAYFYENYKFEAINEYNEFKLNQLDNLKFNKNYIYNCFFHNKKSCSKVSENFKKFIK